jgi:membrane-associated phospholipid phosphatase
MAAVSRFHASEVFLVVYFAYVAAIAPFYLADWGKAWVLAAVVAGAMWGLAQTHWRFRDWAPLALMLTAYREMDWFTPSVHDHQLENTWIVWDRWLLHDAGTRKAIESLGALLPGYLEICYLLVYAVAPVSLAALLLNGSRDRLHRWWLAHLVGTLGCYALFPYFPSEPPRTAFAGQDLPKVTTMLRSVNLAIVGGYGIHSSVFPSAHVASALSAAWGLLFTLKRRRWLGWAMAAYGVSVAIGSFYGRYHYAVDAVAGAAMTAPSWLVLHFMGTRKLQSS